MHLPATGNIERTASDKLGIVRGQKDDSPSDIHWLGDSSQGRWIDKKFLQKVFRGHPLDFGGLGNTLSDEIGIDGNRLSLANISSEDKDAAAHIVEKVRTDLLERGPSPAR